MTPPALKDVFSANAEERRHAHRYLIEHPLAAAAERLAFELLRRLPTAWASDFGAWMSRLSPARYPASDARARRAWSTLRPEASDEAATAAAVRRMWRSTGRYMAEFSSLDRLWDEGRITVQGVEHLAAARKEGRPILLAGVHLGNWEVIGISGARLGYPGAGIAMVLENRFSDRLLTRLRNRIGNRVLPGVSSSGWAMIRELRSGGPLLVFIDDLTAGAVQAPLLGREKPLSGNVSHIIRLARLTNAAVIPMYGVRLGEQARFEVTILPALDLEPGAAADEANKRRLNDVFDSLVTRYLDQWFYALDVEVTPEETSTDRPAP